MEYLFGWIDELISKIEEWFFGILYGSVKWNLEQTNNIFTHSINTVQTQVSQTPDDFSQTLVETLRTISETAVLPVAGILLTYVFCYEIYSYVTDKNRGNEFDSGQMFFLIFKTAIVILLVTNSFDITLAFIDLGQWMVNNVPSSTLQLPSDINESILESIDGIGYALGMVVLTAIVMIASFFMAGIIYLVAWSRIIMILLYVSISPLPFATLMNKNWIGTIGETYIRQILALMLQGFFMIVTLVIYAGLLNKTVELITEAGSPVLGVLMLMVSMGILTLTLTRTHSLAKAVVGAI